MPRIWLALTLALLIAVGAHTPALAQDAVVNNCSDDTDLRAKLTAMQAGTGGTLTFACGAAPVTIVLSGSPLPVIVTETTIVGAGRITLSGGNASRIFYVAESGALTLRAMRLTRGLNNGDGGAIRSDGALTIENSVFTENVSTSGSGGAIVAYGPLHIRGSQFISNRALNGGALYPRHAAVVSIRNSTFRANEATGFSGRGGAMLIWDGPEVTIENSIFESNLTGYVGGAIDVTTNSTLTVSQSTFASNESRNSGAAITNSGTLVVDQSVMHSNRSSAMGTGGTIFNAGVLTLRNSTISGNDGPGLDSWSNLQTTIQFSTIANNRSYGYQSGYGILTSNSTIHMANTILANNATNCQIYSTGVLASQGFNISSDATCALSATGDRTQTDPMLAPLANNGGNTRSHMPLPGSPVLDEGQCIAGINLDQRGIARPQGDACDIGAVEFAFIAYLPAIQK